MKKHVLILGSGGMLGHIVNLRLRSLPDLFEVTDVARSSMISKPEIEMDVTDFQALLKLYESLRPDIIINCVGVLNSNAENNPAEAILTNCYLPHYLEKITAKESSKVIHISTDCVFSGDKGSYLEEDFMDADGFYGRSKALGEIRNKKDLTIRTSIVGPELHKNGIGLFEWFSNQSGVVKGYKSVFWTGVTNVELSKAIVECIIENVTGLYHMVNGNRISKYDLLQFFKLTFDKINISEIIPDNNYQFDKSLVNSRNEMKYKVPSYEKMITDMKLWMLTNKQIYPHYQSIL